MLLMGAIAGDVIGSRFEFHPHRSTDFELFTSQCRFTDDTLLTIAVADALLHDLNYVETIQQYGRRFPNAGFGGFFRRWLHSENPQPYNSYGNGSAMRVSPVGWAFNSVEDVLKEAERSAAITHNHPLGIQGAQAVALAIFLARTGSSKQLLKKEISQRFDYNLDQTLDEIRPHYAFDETCQGSVPQSIAAFLESNNLEDAIRKAVSLGGDADTQACIAGSIAEAFYGGVNEAMQMETLRCLPPDFVAILEEFTTRFGNT
jgi:ADP-ribosylglycohydrolase